MSRDWSLSQEPDIKQTIVASRTPQTRAGGQQPLLLYYTTVLPNKEVRKDPVRPQKSRRDYEYSYMCGGNELISQAVRSRDPKQGWQ